MPDKLKYPFLDMIRLNAPLADEMRRAALRVIDSGRYVGGPEVEDFESQLASLVRAPYVVGVSNGLDALRLILRAYCLIGKLSPGDEVIVPANTYIATVLAVTDAGLRPVLVDADEHTMNLDTSIVERAITPRTKAIMPVHLYGRVCWDKRLAEIARTYCLLVIEDNAQAIGAKSPVHGLFGSDMSGALGHAGAFSFYPTKNVGAVGDAGAVATHDEDLADAVRALANYGSDRRYHNIYQGFNCRLDSIQAAMLSVRLAHIQDENSARFANAACYRNELHHPQVRIPEFSEYLYDSVWHQFVVRVPDRSKFMKLLGESGIGADIHYATPPHRQPCYSEAGLLSIPHPIPVTETLAAEVVSLPISSATSVREAAEIAHLINDFPML